MKFLTTTDGVRQLVEADSAQQAAQIVERESEGAAQVMCLRKRQRGFASIGLHQPKSNHNIGMVMRAAGCYDAALVAASGQRYTRSHTDTQAAHRHLPLINCDDLKAVIPHGAVPVAVDLIDGAVPLPSYVHPTSAFYIFGPEDGTLGPSILSWCRDVVYVPTRHCMNLAATVNVVLYDRLAKQPDRFGPVETTNWPFPSSSSRDPVPATVLVGEALL